MMLTKEQRQLLAVYPAGMVVDTIVNPDSGIARIRAGMCGGSRLDGPIRHFNTGNGRIHAGSFGEEPSVVVTFAQLKKWALSVPAELRDRIKAVRDLERAENARVWEWCHCPTPEECLRVNAGDPMYGGRHHPSEDEYRQHLDVVMDLRKQERALLDEALGLGDDPVGQLDLFDELIGEKA